jgi:hypothetical protein
MEFVALYLAVGGAVGFLCGLLGIGGAIIIIPVLTKIYEAQGMDNALIMHMAGGTSMAIMIFTSAFSLFGHIRHKVQVFSIYRQLAVGIIVGTIAGSILSHFLCGEILKMLFGLFVFSVSLQMIFVKHAAVTGEERLPGRKVTSLASFFIGANSGILGIGCGSIVMTILNCWQVPVRNIIAISTACGLTVAITGTISYMFLGISKSGLPAYSIGYVYWPAFLGTTLGALVFTHLGTVISHKLHTKKLTRILGIVLMLMAIYILLRK